jgi:hypothetical protein
MCGAESDDGPRDAAELRRLRSSQSGEVSLTSFVQQRPSPFRKYLPPQLARDKSEPP